MKFLQIVKSTFLPLFFAITFNSASSIASGVTLQPFAADKFNEAFYNVIALQYEFDLFNNGVIYKSSNADNDPLKNAYHPVYFYLEENGQDEGTMVFNLFGGDSKTRIELRGGRVEQSEFSSDDYNEMEATLQLSNSDAEEYTWMQLHRKKPGSLPVRPPLRLVWIKQGVVDNVLYDDYLWAVFYDENANNSNGYIKDYKKIPLMPRSDDYMKASIATFKDDIYIYINNQLVIKEPAPAQTANFKYFFKIGIYMSSGGSDGKVTVKIDQLRFNSRNYPK